MENLILFPLSEYWWLYAGFLFFVVAMLALDLGVFHRHAHVVSLKEATAWSLTWISLAFLFCIGLWRYAHWKFPQYEPLLTTLADSGVTGAAALEESARLADQVALEFLTGFVVEKALSVDNIFVFAVVFSFFAIPAKDQHRVLFYGIFGALLMRMLFIAAGSALMQYHWVVWAFGGLLTLTGIKILLLPEKPLQPDRNPLIRLTKRFFRITPQLEGERFFVRRDGKLFATPLFVCLIFVEATDIVFAFDSVPAIFAITREPMIVLTSNVFAILGLRALFFLLAGVMDRFHLLRYGLGLVLVFVGLKMVWLNEAFGGKFPIAWSLGIIAVILTSSVAASLLFPPRRVHCPKPVTPETGS
ncbi:TerC family protein [Pelagicoccus sp. SDUM812003]|uniref:TerC family protein n=1 Tax=Pelagicoccus sp. SDUM812003 TaxID=3041267 RepID=UPI00280ED4F0|nr:TerC family protein [Pelagicoccus sp. SDUM812003]MDQ8202581.1 TerC family protein [Pelagicoccus sp. SDUM812003]